MNPAVRRVLLGLLLFGSVNLFGGLGLYLLGEGRWSMGESLYMAIISVSTVGFSELPGLDLVAGGRAMTAGIILAGVGTFAYFQSTLTALIVEGVIRQAWRRKRMKKSIDSLSGHVVVAGVGSTGRQVVEELMATGTAFVAIDNNREQLERASEELMGGKMLYVHGDATRDHTLLAAGMERARGVIATLGNDKDNMFVTLSARTLNPQVRIIAKVVEPEAIPKLTRAGANATVSPNIIGGRRLASEMIRPVVVEFLDQMLLDKDRNLRVEEVVIPAASRFAGQSLKDVPIRSEANVLVVAVRDQNRQFLYNPRSDYVLTEGSVLVVLGGASDVQRLRQMVAGPA